MKKLIFLWFMLGMLFISCMAYAEENKPVEKQTPSSLSFYQQPDAKSAVVGTIKPGGGIIPIFTQNKWIKIADPNNGNVGWIPEEVLKKQGILSIKTVIQYPVSDKERMEFMQKWQVERREMQNAFMRALEQDKKMLDAMAKAFQDATYPFPIPAAVRGSAKTDNMEPVPADKK